MGGEDVVAEVDLAGVEPLTVDVVVNPTDDLVVDEDASGWPGFVVARAEKAVEDLVTTGDQDPGIASLRRPDHDEAIRRRSQNGHLGKSHTLAPGRGGDDRPAVRDGEVRPDWVSGATRRRRPRLCLEGIRRRSRLRDRSRRRSMGIRPRPS